MEQATMGSDWANNRQLTMPTGAGRAERRPLADVEKLRARQGAGDELEARGTAP